MKIISRIAAMSVLFCSAVAGAQSGGSFYLKPTDRVVFYGDSITDQRLYTTFVETFVVTRFPKWKVDFVHSGWGGDRVTGGGGGPVDHRLERDVFPYNPTVVTSMLGMNDGSYRAFDQGIFDTYAKGYEHIVQSLKAKLPGVRITLIQPSPYDDVTRKPNFEGGYNAVLVRYSEFLKDLSGRAGIDLADLNTSVVKQLRTAFAMDEAGSQKIVADRVHPGPGGHLLMAEALLKAWKAPSLVSKVEIDVAGRKITTADNTAISQVNIGPKISWTQKDACLPMPIDMNDAPTALCVKASDVVEALDSEMLSVKGLARGNYALKIDGEKVGSYSHSELASGINLALLNTPMKKQAMAVHALTLKHNNIHFLRWRTVQVPYEKDNLPDMSKALAGLDKMEGDVVNLQRATASPKAHAYEVAPE
ncbi:MAG: SGNH/GDSL hydrolase family protein [Chthonomonadales bacterium]